MERYRLADLNQMSQANFTAALGWVFEHSPWVAEAAWHHRPFGDIDDLHVKMLLALAEADRDAQLALIRAHPDLGTRVRISPVSTQEQTGAGLQELTEDEYYDLLALNRQYTERFGFPFILAVRGHTKHSIIEALRSRLTRTTEDELSQALIQIAKIARFRLEDCMITAEEE